MNDRDHLPRTVLPIPDVPQMGLTTYDAKDPDTKYRRSGNCGLLQALRMFS